MPKSIYDLIVANEIAAYYAEKSSNKIPYLGEYLFPRKKRKGLKLEWIKGAGGLPVVLKPSAFDVNVTYRDRVGISKVETEMPFFKEATLIKEQDRQELLILMDTSNSAYLNEAIARIFDDVTSLIDGAEAQEERMRMQLLTTGRIAIIANGVALEYDYHMKPEHKGKVQAIWTDHANSVPVLDIQKAQGIVSENTGTKPTRLVMNSKTFSNMAMSKSIKMDMNVLSGQNIIVTEAMAKEYFKSKLGIDIQVYDKQFRDETGASKYVPDNTVSFLPEGSLGSTYFGTTPEEADLMSGTDAKVSLVNTGMAITTSKKVDPVNVETKVSMITLPSFEKLDEIFILDTETAQ